MDVTLLVNLLAPFLPRLLSTGTGLVKEASNAIAAQAGEAVWVKAQEIWEQLGPKVKAKPAALEAANDMVQDPDDSDCQAALRQQLKKLLAEDEGLAAAIAKILKDELSEGVGDRINVQTTGDQSPAIGKIQGDSVNIRLN